MSDNRPDQLDVSAASFTREVLEESYRRPVLVDFWADWCGPCKMLMPVLSSLATAYGGRFRLAKVNSDAEQKLAGQFGIRSLPTVMCFRNGQPVDQFMGVQPESVIRAMIDRHVERPSDRIREEANARLMNGDAAGAVEALHRAIALDPQHAPLKIDLAQALLASGDAEAAETELKQLPLDVHEQDSVKQLLAKIVFAKNLDGTSLASLREEAASHPDDPALLERLAAALMVAGESAEALECYLTLMRRFRNHNDNAGHRGLLAAFEVLGPRHELVNAYRRKMVNLLY